MAGNKSLAKAKNARQDEFYTRKIDIENELRHYAKHFEGKVVYCNCDDPQYSEFWKFFVRNFKPWKLKKLMATHYETNEHTHSYKLEMLEAPITTNVSNNDKTIITEIPCNGDFRSEPCIELLKEADIVVTNPPFSLLNEYMNQLFKYNKKFLILGTPQAIKYKEIFPLIKDNKMWLGYKAMSSDMYFHVPNAYKKWLVENKKEGSGYKIVDGEIMGRTQAVWYTNLDVEIRHEPLDLRGNYYDENKFKKYDNYDALEVGRVEDIPCDYDGLMGVPISFLSLLNPEQFEIIGSSDIPETMNGIVPLGKDWIRKYKEQGGTGHYTANMKSVGYSGDGKTRIVFSRIIIRNRNPQKRRNTK